MGRGEVAGTALALAAAGAVLTTSALRNAPTVDTLRALLRGQVPPAGAPAITPSPVVPATSGPQFGGGSAGGGDTAGGNAVKFARQYLGVPYVFGGHSPRGFDCSGLITYILHTHMGLELPSNVHTVTSVWYVWNGCETVDWEDQQPGDLVVWWSHMGLATGNGRMIHAPHTGDVVREANIWRVPEPLIRRPKAYRSLAGRGGSGTF